MNNQGPSVSKNYLIFAMGGLLLLALSGYAADERSNREATGRKLESTEAAYRQVQDRLVGASSDISGLQRIVEREFASVSQRLNRIEATLDRQRGGP